MTVKVIRPEINVREKLRELDKQTGIAGESLLRANTPQEQFNLLGAGRRNMLINANFDINQRGAASTITVSDSDNQAYIVDRWRSYALGTTCDVSVQEVVLPNGHKVKSIKTTSNGNATWLHPFQCVEAEDWMAGQIVTLSAWVRTSFPGQRLRICDTVTCHLIGEVIPADGEWHYITASHRMPDTISGPHIQYHPGFQSAAGDGDYQEFACPQMEFGPVATPFEYRGVSEELVLCKRYYQLVTSTIRHHTNIGGALVDTILHENVQIPIPMRDTPSCQAWGDRELTKALVDNADNVMARMTNNNDYSGDISTNQINVWDNKWIFVYFSMKSGWYPAPIYLELISEL